MVFVFFIVLLAYASVHYYIGNTIKKNLFSHQPKRVIKIYWIVLFALGAAYPAGKLIDNYLEGFLIKWLIVLGAHWMGALFYLLLFILALDAMILLGRLLQRVSNKDLFKLKLYKPTILRIAIGVISVLLMIGSWSAWNPKVTSYTVDIPKTSPTIDSFQIVLLSDIHLGAIIGSRFLSKGVDIINDLQPDLILIAGDIVDDDIAPLKEEKIENLFMKLEAKYGVFAVIGNHEYIAGTVLEAIDLLSDSGIQILRDEYVLIEDSFYLVGRDDKMRNAIMDAPRLEIEDLLDDGVNIELPLIVMDHQPLDFKALERAGVDLLLSGHTHHGQLFPNNYITRWIYKVDSGHFQKDNLQIVVTSGFGTWGPPYRIGSRSEIVLLTINFIEQ